jgi:type IV fimbrial biogenesis protein FimT
MLTKRRIHGFTLVELMVTIGILAFLMLAAAPSVGAWIENSRLRASAESILNGLQRARAEAVSRNTLVRFQLTSTADNGCALDTNGKNWVVSLDPNNSSGLVAGHCGNKPDTTASPWIVEVRPSADGSSNTTVVNGSNANVGFDGSVLFNGLGKPVGLAGTSVTYSITSSTDQCAKDGGKVTCLQVVVSPSGQVRMCNPGITNTADPQAC